MALISCKNVSLAYDGERVVEQLSFDVNPGDYLCVVGENGSGKSTLMKALLGLIRPCGGSIEYSDGLERNAIGYLPQQTQIQRDFPASVEEVVLSGTLGGKGLFPRYTKADRELAAEKMAALGISGIAKSSYHELSGGQQQRVLLARALCATKKLLLLDEPAAGLDPLVTAELYTVIRSLNRDNGITVIMISHDLASALEDATHILHLHHRAEFFGTAEEYRLSEAGRRLTGGRS